MGKGSNLPLTFINSILYLPLTVVIMNTEGLIRLKKYRQMKDGIRGSGQHMIVGIDIAKDKHHAFVGTVTGQTLLRRLIFENTIDGFRRFLAHVEAM